MLLQSQRCPLGGVRSCEHNETIILTLSVMTDFFPLQCIYMQRLNNFRFLHVFPFSFMYFRYRVLSRGWALHPIWSPVLRRTDQTNVGEWQADNRSSLTVSQQHQPRPWVLTLHPNMVEGSTVTQIHHTSENFSWAASRHGVSIFFPGQSLSNLLSARVSDAGVGNSRKSPATELSSAGVQAVKLLKSRFPSGLRCGEDREAAVKVIRTPCQQ